MKKLLLVITLIFGFSNTLQAETVDKIINEDEAKQKCEKNDGKACLEYGKYQALSQKDWNEADVYYKKSCDLGNGSGCYEYGLGLAYKALVAYGKSCDLYVLNACQQYDKLTNSKYKKEKGFWKVACEKNPGSFACDKYKNL